MDLSKLPDTVVRKCGMCKHWKKLSSFSWGSCTVGTPVWARGSGGVIMPTDEQAMECEMFVWVLEGCKE